MRKLALCFLIAAVTVSAHAQVLLQPGQAVMTCFSDNNKGQAPALSRPVAALFDIRNPAAPFHAPGANTNWAAPHQIVATLGDLKNNEVFGVALDDASPPNIYLTSTVVYKSTHFASNEQAAPGTGQVFKIRASDGAALQFGPPLPNTGQGLGNIAFDATTRQFFVTNFADGKIYRLDMSGNQLGVAFDPFGTAPPTAGGFAPLGQRLWGVGVFRGRVYFGLWSSDLKPGAANTVWSVAINPITHDFGALGTAPDVILPPLNGLTMPVSDIEFNAAGRMLIAQHGMDSTAVDINTLPHQSSVLEYVLSGTTWVASANVFKVGIHQTQTNAAGGVDYACPLNGEQGYVVSTGDALQFSPQTIYGLQITPQTGGTVTGSFLVDADNVLSAEDKTQIGDVDVYNTCDAQCFQSRIIRVLCAGDGTGDYFVTFTLKNLTNQTIYHAYITGLSPAGATANPNYINLISTPVAPGGTVTIGPIRIHGAPPGALSFTVSIHNKDLEECCASRVTVDLPRCECAQITSDKGPSCTLLGSRYTYTFTAQNLFNGPVSYVLLTPDTPSSTTFSSYVFDLSANPMAPGASRTFSVTIGGVQGGQNICFRISFHNANFVTCCSILHCVRLPRCIDWTKVLVPGLGTTIALNGDWVVLTNPDGKPDCTLPLAPDDTGFDLHWLPIESASLAAGAYIEQQVVGTVDGGAPQRLATLRTVRTAGGSELRTEFPALGSTRYTYEFYREGALIGTQSGVPSDIPAIMSGGRSITTDAHFTTSGVPASQEGGTECSGPGLRCLFAGYTFQEASAARIADSATYMADEVRVIPEDGRLTAMIRLSSLGFHAEGLREITLTELTIRPDRAATGTTTTSLNTNAADWQVVAPGAERAANVVNAPPAAWPAPFTGSQWISVDTTGFSVPGTTQLAFQRCFCLGSSGSATLDLELRADNEASVLLNGRLLAGPGGAFNGAALSVHRDGTIGDGFFAAGPNCIRVEVTDFGSYTGVNVAGTVIGPTCAP